jgi:hypothetical protein
MTAGTTIRGVGLGCSSPLAPTVRVGVACPVAIPRSWFPTSAAIARACSPEVDPEPPDLNAPRRPATTAFDQLGRRPNSRSEGVVSRIGVFDPHGLPISS